MRFSGLQKTSLIDFPDRIATVLFTPGCNLSCPFCHNWKLVLEPQGPFLSDRTVLQILEERRRFIDAVVITGGEPTIHQQLPLFLKELNQRGFSVKLDTNGFFPAVLKQCLLHLDYVAVDVKSCLEKYPLLGAGDMSHFLHTIAMVKNGKTEYEFRTTVVPGFVNESCLEKMGNLVKGAKHFAFQQFVPKDTLDASFTTIKPYSQDTIHHFAEIMKTYVEHIEFRI